ncbi:MAG: hypothetical protein IJ188_10130 [Clostridia bacterium]|nr:hypothetical protein [Clostridia bacterium]
MKTRFEIASLLSLDALSLPEEAFSFEGLFPEEALALAIALQAVADWRKAREVLRRCPDHAPAIAQLQETEVFFRSRWFHTLMDLEGEGLLRQLRGAEGSALPAAPEKRSPQIDQKLRRHLRYKRDKAVSRHAKKPAP